MNQSMDSVAAAELRKFFSLHVETDRFLEMWSGYIDQHWHNIQRNPEYDRFCVEACGTLIAHAPFSGSGQISWIEAYEERFGSLPEVWFRAEDGSPLTSLREKYEQTGRVYASWNCGPVQPDPMDRRTPKDTERPDAPAAPVRPTAPAAPVQQDEVKNQ